MILHPAEEIMVDQVTRDQVILLGHHMVTEEVEAMVDPGDHHHMVVVDTGEVAVGTILQGTMVPEVEIVVLIQVTVRNQKETMTIQFLWATFHLIRRREILRISFEVILT